MDKYFDYASATPLADDVRSVMLPFLTEKFHNPSALYGPSRIVKEQLGIARGCIAEVLGVRSSELVFTGSCTEANNLVISGVMREYPGKKILISAIEHDAVRKPGVQYSCATIPVDSEGIIRLDALESLIDDETVLISVMYVNNEIGTVQPLRKIAQLVEKIKKTRGPAGLPLYLHSDAAQAPNTESIVLSSTNVDLMSLSSAKLYGPKGVGCLYIKSGVKLSPMILGGGQESGLRSGTENVAGIVGFAQALKQASDSHSDEKHRLRALTELLSDELTSLGGIVFGGYSSFITSVYFPGVDAEYLLYELDARGFMVATGSACHAQSGEMSHVLQSVGYSDEAAKSTLRLSLGRFSDERGVRQFCNELAEILAKHKA